MLKVTCAALEAPLALGGRQRGDESEAGEHEDWHLDAGQPDHGQAGQLQQLQHQGHHLHPVRLRPATSSAPLGSPLYEKLLQSPFVNDNFKYTSTT